MSNARPLTILFACFAVEHSSTKRKLDQLRARDVTISVYDPKVDKNRTNILYRIASFCYLKLFWRLLTSKEPIWWFWGADACFIGSLAGLLRFDKKIIWDIADVHPALLSRSTYSIALRGIEQILLKRADKLLLTSAAYFDYYYSGRIDKNRVFVIENLLDGQPMERSKNRSSGALNVVYPGILRTNSMLAHIIDAAELCGGKIKFHLWGFFDRNVKAETIKRISDNPNVIYHGEYTDFDLPRIYEGMHITFGLVDVDANENEKWLLHNRLYQAGAFKCPLIATQGSYVGKETLSRRLGWVVKNDPIDLAIHLVDLFLNIDSKYFNTVNDMPDPSKFYFSEQYDAFLSSL